MKHLCQHDYAGVTGSNVKLVMRPDGKLDFEQFSPAGATSSRTEPEGSANGEAPCQKT